MMMTSEREPQRALLIDDDRVVRSVLREIVMSFGYEADAAASGAEGIALFEQNRYDVVLTDLRMPQMTDWQVLAAVRARDARTPVIIITGSPLYPDDRRISEPGVLLVRKPVEPRVLEEEHRQEPDREDDPQREVHLRPRSRGLRPLSLQFLDQLPVRGGLDDLVELRAVVGDEAHALDEDVVDHPPVVPAQQAVVDRHRGALLRVERGLDRRQLAARTDGVTDVGDPLAGVPLDLGNIRPLQEIGEERHELGAVLVAEALPVAAQRPPRGLLEVEDLVGDGTDRRAPVLRPGFGLQRRVLEDLDRLVHRGADLVRRGARPARDRDRDGESDCESDAQGSRMVHRAHLRVRGHASHVPAGDGAPGDCRDAGEHSMVSAVFAARAAPRALAAAR